MSNFQKTSPLGEADELLAVGPPFGDVFPRVEPPKLHNLTARRHALEVLALFISKLHFQRTDSRDLKTTIAFRIPLDRIHVFQPDSTEGYDGKPALGILPGQGTHETYGLGPSVPLEGTDNLYCPHSVLVRTGDYIETIGLEVWGAYDAEREAVLAGIQQVFRLSEDSSALRLRCPAYYDRVASFALQDSNVIDDDQSAANRRRGHVFLKLQIQEVTLVHSRPMVPILSHEVLPPGA